MPGRFSILNVTDQAFIDSLRRKIQRFAPEFRFWGGIAEKITTAI